MPTDKDLGRVLRYDPVAAAERATGIRSSEWRDNMAAGLVGLSMAAAHYDREQKMLDAAGDTGLLNTVEHYLSIARQEGFEVVLALPFDGRDTQETLYVLFHKSDCILLCFDTYGGKSVNGGHFYYNWEPNAAEVARAGERTWYFECLSSGGWVNTADGSCIWEGYHDCRKALRYHLRQLRAMGAFVSPWKVRPSLWLLHYMDTDREERDYKVRLAQHDAITAERIGMLPEYVQKAITP